MTGTKPSFSALVSFRNTNRGLLAKTYEHFKPLMSGIENFTFNHLCVKKSFFGIFVAFTYSNTVRWSSSQSGLRYPIQSNSTLPLLLWSFWDASDLCRTLCSKVMSIFSKIFHQWHVATGMPLTWGRNGEILLHYNIPFAKRPIAKPKSPFWLFPPFRLSDFSALVCNILLCEMSEKI